MAGTHSMIAQRVVMRRTRSKIAWKRYLVDEQHVMDNTQHQDAVECTLGTLQQAETFGVLPADRGSGTGDVGDQRKNGLALCAGFAPVRVGGLHIGVPCNDTRPGGNGNAGIVTRVAANVKHALRLSLCERPFNKRGLARMVFRAVVACRGGVVAPAGAARRRGQRAECAAKLLQRAAQHVGGDFGRLPADRASSRRQRMRSPCAPAGAAA